MAVLSRRRSHPKKGHRTARTLAWFDDRLGGSDFAERTLNKIFPDHWSFMFGEIAFYSFLILLVTGVYLTFFYDASNRPVVYNGSYAPLQGSTVSAAYQTTVDLSFKVRAGLVFRQTHHWAAIVFIGAIVIHLARVFFTGAFRKPRELNWGIGLALLILSFANGFVGYSLPDDLLSGTGLRIANSIVLSIPVAGEWVASLLFGGEFPAGDIIERFFVIHVLLLPAALVGLVTAHLAVLWQQKHTDFPGRGKREDNIVGSRIWPNYAMKSAGLFFIVLGITAGLGGLAQINPIWLYGPYKPAAVSAGSQPDWYMGWLDGALRMFPNWEIRAFGHTVSNLFFPALVLPGITFVLMGIWPWLEARVTKDHESHNLLDRPRDRPVRSAFGVAALVFYGILLLGSATDILSTTFHLSFEAIVRLLQVLLFVGPVIGWLVTRRVCHELSKGRVRPIRRPTGGVITRDAEGRFHEEHTRELMADDGDDENIGADPLRANRDIRIRIGAGSKGPAQVDPAGELDDDRQ